MQVITLCISTTMVLTLLGLVVLSVLTAHNLSDYVRENLTVTVVLNDSVTEKEGKAYCQQLQQRHYARQTTYISKEQALKEQTAAMGSDPSEFLGMNPFVATIEMQVLADYANNVNRNLRQALVILLGLAVLLIIISYSLISNSVRLSVYSRRFSIHTMKLVGASWSFIRKPFLKRALTIGFVSSLLACGVLAGVVYVLYEYQPGADEVITWCELVITAVAVLASGFVMMLLCSWLSVNKFLRMRAGELYKI